MNFAGSLRPFLERRFPSETSSGQVRAAEVVAENLAPPRSEMMITGHLKRWCREEEGLFAPTFTAELGFLQR